MTHKASKRRAARAAKAPPAAEAAERRQRRRRLSSIDLLPEEATADVMWAHEQLKARRLPQLAILAEFNRRLADRGLGPISKSAFNRRALWLMAQGEAIVKAREIAGILAEKLDATEGDVGLLLNELVKSIAFDVLSNAQLTDRVSMTMVVNAATALDRLERARKFSVDTRVKIDKEFKKRAAKAVERAAKARGLTRQTTDAIKRQILGLDLRGHP